MTDPRMTPTNDAPVTVEPQDRQLFSRLFGVLPSASPMDQRALRDIASHRLAALASAPACPALPDHSDIMETIANAGDDWQKQGYATALAEVRDMADVGRSLLERIAENSSEGPLKGWHPADCPTEVVCDLLNMLADASAPAGDGDAIEAAARAMCDRVNGIGDYDENIAQRRPGWTAQAKAALEAAALARPRAAVGEQIEERATEIVEECLMRHGIERSACEGTRTDARAVLALQSPPAKVKGEDR